MTKRRYAQNSSRGELEDERRRDIGEMLEFSEQRVRRFLEELDAERSRAYQPRHEYREGGHGAETNHPHIARPEPDSGQHR